MKPHVFVSSTFYDLKYMRDDLSNFIKAHDFEPIMFEEGDIGYTPWENLDTSCYEAMRNADMVVLIIGGRYGSPASGENKDELEEYMSVTREEFKTAVEAGIPVFAFVEASVYAEYGVYRANLENIEEDKIKIAFKATKSINVFRFIKHIESLGNIAIIEFKKSSEIKEYLGKQWSDMFKKYLEIVKARKEDEKILNVVDEMKMLIKKMGEMVEGMGEEVLKHNEDIFEAIRTRQRAIEFVYLFIGQIGIRIKEEYDSKQAVREFLLKMLDVFYISLNSGIWETFQKGDDKARSDFFNYFKEKGVDIIGSTRTLDTTLAYYSDLLIDGEGKEMVVKELLEEENFKELCR